MRASESSLVFLMLLLTLENSQGGKTHTGWRPQRIKKLKAGLQLPITAQDIGKPWCRMKAFPQTIRRRGCEARTITNNICYGQCRSFYIPLRKIEFESCSFCTPVSSETETVVLNCPNRSPPSRLVKKVKIITACSCRVCGKKYI